MKNEDELFGKKSEKKKIYLAEICKDKYSIKTLRGEKISSHILNSCMRIAYDACPQ